MPQASREEQPSGLRATYAASALARPENRIAGAVTLLVLLGVAVASRVPLAPDSQVDLRQPERSRGSVQASALGFGGPGPQGRRLLGKQGRIVWNRPLPKRFVLSIEAHAQTQPGATLALRVGDSNHQAEVTTSPSWRSFEVLNAQAGRVVEIGSEHGLVVSRLRIGLPPP